jgi:hypothetical protein
LTGMDPEPYEVLEAEFVWGITEVFVGRGL